MNVLTEKYFQTHQYVTLNELNKKKACGPIGSMGGCVCGF